MKLVAEKGMKSKSVAKASQFRIFDHDDLTAKDCYSGCSRPPDVDETKFLIKMTRPQNIVPCILMFCGLVIFFKYFDPINIRRL